MTAREVLDGIKARLTAATPGPWETMKSGLLGTRVVSVDGEWEGIIPVEFITLVTPALRKPTDAVFIAAAPVDVARLTRAVEEALRWAEKFETNQSSDIAKRQNAQFDLGYAAGRRAAGNILRTAIEAALGEAS